jgi:hypothetical protein
MTTRIACFDMHTLKRAANSFDDVMSIGEPSRMQCREAVRLLLSLGIANEMPTLAGHFPHILNRVSDLWVDAELTERYLQEVILSARQERKGFPSQALGDREASRRNRPRLSPRGTTTGWELHVWR